MCGIWLDIDIVGIPTVILFLVLSFGKQQNTRRIILLVSDIHFYNFLLIIDVIFLEFFST